MCHIPLAQGKGLRTLVENCYTESDMMNCFKGVFFVYFNTVYIHFQSHLFFLS